MSGQRVFTDDQVAAFRRDGFLVVRGMYDADEMREILAWTREIEHAPERPGGTWMYFEQSKADGSRILSRVENFVPHHEGFRRLITTRKMQQAVSELFGEPAVLFKDKINFKLPGGDGFKPHQDVQAGWDDFASLHITAMVAIDATNEANGSLEMLPGMHDRGLLAEKWAPLPEGHEQGREYVAVHCAPGDAVFFDSYAPHRSGPNRTPDKRRVLYITYNRASEGDHREAYYAAKHRNYPPDIERDPDKSYAFKV
ncbi:MAG: phytanoyl-CoA dioxygenase family protein [Xanthomonadales bacterium]|nr:phytanoyl-CoA dioxygenase family protein [Xanthomonadales bacterium]